jgi:hypothetical protein
MVHKVEFTKSDQRTLVRQFKGYSNDELADFIAKSVVEEAMLILSHDDERSVERKEMIDTLKSLRAKASEELRSRK